MTPGHVLQAVSDAGIRLYIQDGFLRYNGPAGAFYGAMRASVKAVQQTLMTDWACIGCGQVCAVFYGIDRQHRCRQCFEEGVRCTR